MQYPSIGCWNKYVGQPSPHHSLTRQRIDPSVHFDLSPWSARRRVLVKSSIGCCERCRGPLPTYDRCIALPTRKLLQKLVDRGSALFFQGWQGDVLAFEGLKQVWMR